MESEAQPQAGSTRFESLNVENHNMPLWIENPAQKSQYATTIVAYPFQGSLTSQRSAAHWRSIDGYLSGVVQ